MTDDPIDTLKSLADQPAIDWTDPQYLTDDGEKFPGATIDAPWGFKSNGEPYARRPSAGAVRRMKARSDRPRAKGAEETPEAPRDARKAAVADPLALISGALIATGVQRTQARNDGTIDPLVADGLVIQNAADDFATAVCDLAETNKKLAKLLDKSAQASPYAAIGIIAITVGAQIAVNHGRLPAGILGTVSPTEMTMANAEDANAE